MGLKVYFFDVSLRRKGFPACKTALSKLQMPTSHRFCYRFADQFGNRAALTLSCASASAFFLLLSMSTSVPILFLSRLPSVFMHGLPGKVSWV
ncbi:hypothetical protein ASZ78_008837 [Callipepla squamata]|uniref:Uncharacterized protein n=1 Tax=Callipepla squamata TaxID=9009 RepID=A0A226N7R6_CALSU|nr:hypothetical protein ASZ78_008837 [Callipepla squamata]